jgi:hypothetical protein
MVTPALPVANFTLPGIDHVSHCEDSHNAFVRLVTTESRIRESAGALRSKAPERPDWKWKTGVGLDADKPAKAAQRLWTPMPELDTCTSEGMPPANPDSALNPS